MDMAGTCLTNIQGGFCHGTRNGNYQPVDLSDDGKDEAAWLQRLNDLEELRPGVFGQFRKYYEKMGQAAYSPDVTDGYIRLQQERVGRGEISCESFKQRRYIGRRMNEYFLTGDFRYSTKEQGTSFVLCGEYENLADQFLCSKEYGDKSRYDARWTIRKYLQHMEKLGHATLSDVTIDDVREYILKAASNGKVSGLHNTLLYLRQFHIYLKEAGIPAPDCVELLSYKVYREMPIQSYVTDEELERILGVINTDTEMGKRDRAIILVGATTGLRGIDIIRMKLTDINWRKGEIKIVQGKTGLTIHVPLMKETGEALQDYILNARPRGSGCEEVFLRVYPPKENIHDTTCIGYMFRSYQEKAGIRRQPFDGKGFHGLRRRLAKKLIVSGSPLTTVSQILGHDDIRSARQYLSLNTDDIKECALDFSGISLERGCLL